MRLRVKNEHRPVFRAPTKTLSSIASWLVVAPLLSFVTVASTSTIAEAASTSCSGATCTVTFGRDRKSTRLNSSH